MKCLACFIEQDHHVIKHSISPHLSGMFELIGCILKEARERRNVSLKWQFVWETQINWQMKWQTSYLLAYLIVQNNYSTILSPHLSQKVNVHTLYVLHIIHMPAACAHINCAHNTRVCTHGWVWMYNLYYTYVCMYVCTCIHIQGKYTPHTLFTRRNYQLWKCYNLNMLASFLKLKEIITACW